MRRSIVAVGAVVLVAASVSGATEQPPERIQTAIPSPHFGTVQTGPFSRTSVRARFRPLRPDAPTWSRRLFDRSVRVLIALTDPASGATIAGDRDGWDYVWPRDAGAAALALRAAGLRPEAQRVVSFLSGLELDRAARFNSDGSPVPGRPAAGDGEGWVAAAERAVDRPRVGTVLRSGSSGNQIQDSPAWRDRQDYGENVTGDLLANAIAAGASATEIDGRFLTDRGFVRQEDGSEQLDSAAAWAVTVFPRPRLRQAARRTLLDLTGESTRFGIPPMEGWTPGEVWTAPTAWSAWAFVELGKLRAADRLLAELHRAETRAGTLPERVDALTGAPTSTTPLVWSHAFAILALRARYG